VAGFLFEAGQMAGAPLIKTLLHLLNKPFGHRFWEERLPNHFMNDFQFALVRMRLRNLLLSY
jgi:hypothetical protein